MGSEDSDLSIDHYVRQLKDLLGKAQKVFGLSTPNPKLNYVVEELQYAIDVAEGKVKLSNEEDKRRIVSDALDVAGNAIAFHGKFTKVTQELENSKKEVDLQQNKIKKLGG